MPELPEVEVLRRSLEPHLQGQRFSRVRVQCAALREPVVAATLTRRLRGRRISGLRRRGKYLWIDVEGDSTLVVHLGMSGRLTLVEEGTAPEPHQHVSFYLGSRQELRFRDPRRFGLVFALPTSRLDRDRHFLHLGLEPLDALFNGQALRQAARGRRGPVKSFLMDARIVVGVGNIYATEALFRAGIHPLRSVARISLKRYRRLADATVEVLRQAIAEGGTTLNDFTNGQGESGYFQVSLAVYGREGQPCRRCSNPIKRQVTAGRSTFYCPRCQR